MNNIIIKTANSFGICDIGFCAFNTVKSRLLECRAAMRIPQNAASIILFLFPYKVREERPEKISRYAAVPDYHTVCGEYLKKIKTALEAEFPDNGFEPFIDNSPIPEVYAASCAGLGAIGENGLLINERWGSWCFIGEIVTDLVLECANNPKKCSLCGVCKTACPRGIRSADCLSALSQQKKPLSEDEKKALYENNIIWGCDICAEVCPLNRSAELTYIEEFKNGYRDEYTPGEDIKNRAYAWRGEKVIRRNYEILNGENF